MESLGNVLFSEREKKQIKLEDISSKTNISLKSLQAMEDDRFGEIPGKFYLKQYIKSYINALGCDEQTFREDHRDAIAAAMATPMEKNKSYIARLQYSRFRRKRVVVTLLTIMGIVVLLAVAIFLKESFNGGSSLNDIFISGRSTEPVIRGPALAFPTPVGQYSIDRYPLTVNIRFRENCWMQASRGGRRVVEKVFKKGENAEFKGYRLTFLLGNPAAVDFRVNGREVSYLKRLSRSERLDLHPAEMERIFSK